jgi:transcriptional regulator with XRE-family HTH domain
MTYICPICGYDRLTKPAANFYVCPCCGTEFGSDDLDRDPRELRSGWIDRDMPWFSRSTLKPKNWNAYRQLIKAGFGTDLVIHLRMNEDINFRYEVNKAFSEVNISKQLRALREREGAQLTQAQLAARTEMKQSRISELEGMNYSSGRSISTLERLAKGLGVAFYYSFIPWDEFIARVKGASTQRAVPTIRETNLAPATIFGRFSPSKARQSGLGIGLQIAQQLQQSAIQGYLRGTQESAREETPEREGLLSARETPLLRSLHAGVGAGR